MKHLLFLLFLSLGFSNIYCQNKKLQNGIYLTIEDLKSQKPSLLANLNIEKRSKSDKFYTGGSDYRLVSDIDSISKKFIRKNIYCYVEDDSLMINCRNHDRGSYFASCLTNGNFLVFYASETDAKVMSKSLGYTLLFGAIGGAIIGANESDKRYLMVLSIRTGNLRFLTKEYMKERLKDFPDVLIEFNKETNPDTESVLVKYINMLNEKIGFTKIE